MTMYDLVSEKDYIVLIEENMYILKCRIIGSVLMNEKNEIYSLADFGYDGISAVVGEL